MRRLLEQETANLLHATHLFLIQKWSPKETFHTSKEAPHLELRGDAPALSKFGHVPQACKNES